MSKLTDDLMKQLHFISEAGNTFMHEKKQRLTGQQRVLAILRLEDGLSQSYLGEVLDLRPSSIAELLKKLENSGDITRKEDENDKRTKLVYLTANGRKKADDNASLKDADYSESFFSGLNDDEQQQFSIYLEKIADGWDDNFKKQTDKFVDPMDRMQYMQKIHETMMEKFGDDWQDMSPEDMRHQMRKEMRKAMKNGDLPNHHEMDMKMGFMPNMGFGCGHRGRREFRFGNKF